MADKMNRVAILLAEGFEEIEALTPADFLRRAGMKVDLVSISDDIIVKGAHDISIVADTFLVDLNKDEFGTLILPGGAMGAKNLIASALVKSWIEDFQAKNKIIGSICAGPTVLDAAEIMDNRNYTCYPGCEKSIKAGICHGEEVVVRDGNVITAMGPGAAGEFAFALIEALADEQLKDEIIKDTITDKVKNSYFGR